MATRLLLILAFCLHLAPPATAAVVSACGEPVAQAICPCCEPASCGCFEAPDAPPAESPLPPPDGRQRAGVDLFLTDRADLAVAYVLPPPPFERPVPSPAVVAVPAADRLASLCVWTT